MTPDGSIDLSNYMTKAEVSAAITLATAGMLKEEDLITINGESLVGGKDINITELIPESEIVSDVELNTTIVQAMTIEEL